MTFAFKSLGATLARWLAATPRADLPAIQARLLEQLVGKNASSISGVAIVIFLAVVALWRTGQPWTLLWIIANPILLANQFRNYARFRAAQAKGATLPVGQILANGIVWASVTGLGCYACVMTGDVVLAALAGIHVAVICAGFAARTANVPRYASTKIVILCGSYALACFSARIDGFGLMAVESLIALAGVLSLTWHNSEHLVELFRVEAENRFLAAHDALTGLANRVQLHERLRRSLAANPAQEPTNGHPVSVMFIDLDGFKAINDAHGHAVGDALLIAVAARLRDEMRGSDLVARIGGDEFVVMLVDIDPALVGPAAERLIDVIALPYELDGGLRVQVGASIGTVSAVLDSWSADDLIARADQALYAAKRDGGGVHRAQPVDA